jgi:hypothetical protein
MAVVGIGGVFDVDAHVGEAEVEVSALERCLELEGIKGVRLAMTFRLP